MPVIFSEEKRKELEKDIKAAALRMFGEKGIRNTTVSEIAQSVGIAKGTFYNFFESKGALICSIIDDYDQKAYDRIYERLGSKKKKARRRFLQNIQQHFHPRKHIFLPH